MELSVREIYERIIKTYVSQEPRRMFIHKSMCNYEKLGAVFFAIEGSPPKGYAIFRSDHENSGRIVYFDVALRKRYRTSENEPVTITDLDQYEDIFDPGK